MPEIEIDFIYNSATCDRSPTMVIGRRCLIPSRLIRGIKNTESVCITVKWGRRGEWPASVKESHYGTSSRLLFIMGFRIDTFERTRHREKRIRGSRLRSELQKSMMHAVSTANSSTRFANQIILLLKVVHFHSNNTILLSL